MRTSFPAFPLLYLFLLPLLPVVHSACADFSNLELSCPKFSLSAVSEEASLTLLGRRLLRSSPHYSAVVPVGARIWGRAAAQANRLPSAQAIRLPGPPGPLLGGFTSAQRPLSDSFSFQPSDPYQILFLFGPDSDSSQPWRIAGQGRSPGSAGERGTYRGPVAAGGPVPAEHRLRGRCGGGGVPGGRTRGLRSAAGEEPAGRPGPGLRRRKCKSLQLTQAY